MAYGVTKLRKAQLGLEGTKGTIAAATALWLGDVDLKDNRKTVIPPENIGYLGPVDRSYIPYADASASFKETPANFEQFGYPFSAGVKDVVTGSANGGTSNGKVYAYPLATTALPTVKSYTIESGDNAQEYVATYGVCTEINLKGTAKEVVTIASEWAAQTMNTGTFTGAIAVPLVEQILFQNGKIYCNTTAETIGVTQLTKTWLGFDMKIKTGMKVEATGDGAITFSFDKNIGSEVTGKITFEHETQGIARYTDFVAGTTKQIRMLFTGSALTGSGGTFSTKVLQIDFCMKIMNVTWADKAGDNTITVDYTAVYNPTAGLYWSATVCNILAALV